MSEIAIRLDLFSISPNDRRIQGLRVLGDCRFARLLAGTLAGTRQEPSQYVPLGIPNATSTRRAEMARSITPEPILVHGVRMDAENVGNLFSVEGTPLGRIAKQLHELF